MPKAVLENQTSAEVLAENEELKRKLAEVEGKTGEEGGSTEATQPGESKGGEAEGETPASGGESTEGAKEGNSEGTSTDAPAAGSEGDKKEMTESNNADVKKLSEENKRLSDRLRIVESDKHASDVELICREFSDEGVPPSIVEIARKYLLCDKDESRTYQLSEKDSNGKVNEVKRTLSEAIVEILDAMPKVQLGEATVVDADGSGDLAGKSDAEKTKDTVKKYMEDNKISDYRVAFDKCLSEGKITIGNRYAPRSEE